jgi:hypothetical protein
MFFTHQWALINYTDEYLQRIRSRHYDGIFYKDNTVLNFIREIKSVNPPNTPLIFIINSCGAVEYNKEDPECIKRYDQIMFLQEKSRLSAINMGIRSGTFVQNSRTRVPISRATVSQPTVTSSNSAITEEFHTSAFLPDGYRSFLYPQNNATTEHFMGSNASRAPVVIPPKQIVKVDNIFYSCFGGICRRLGLGGTRKFKRKFKRSLKKKKTRKTP